MNKISISDLLSQLFNERIIRFNVPQNFITEKISSTLFLDLWTRIKLSGIKNERKSWSRKKVPKRSPAFRHLDPNDLGGLRPSNVENVRATRRN